MMMSLSVPVNFLSVQHSNRHEDCPYVSCCSDFWEVYIKLFTFSLRGFRKRAAFVYSDSKSRVGEFRNVNLESCSQILEESKRIQDLVQVIGRKQNIKDN